MDALTDADYNVAVGTSALSSDTQGSKSTAIGHSALYTQNFSSATDSHNTAVGYNAGLLIPLVIDVPASFPTAVLYAVAPTFNVFKAL